MKSKWVNFFLLFFLSILFTGQWSDPTVPKTKSPLEDKETMKLSKISENLGNLPLYFISNKGQVNKRALFYAKTPQYTLWITKKGLVFDSIKKQETEVRSQEAGENIKSQISNPSFETNQNKKNPNFQNRSSKTSYRDISRLMFVGAKKNPEIIPLESQKLRVNYFKGNDKSKWVGNVPTSRAVLYKNLYKQIDLKVYGIGKQIEYDWIVHPGGDPSEIRFEYINIEKIKISEKGDLEISSVYGTIIHKKPFTYQYPTRSPSNKKSWKNEVESGFYQLGKNLFGFTIGKYDKIRTLYVDPVILTYSTFLNGQDNGDTVKGIDVDDNGFIYITGYTYSSDFPIKNQYMYAIADFEAFITKIDPNSSGASSLLYSTFFGGMSRDYGHGITVDSNECVYITGYTEGSGFPLRNEFQTNYMGNRDAFLSKLDTTQSGTSSLLYSTYIGGTGADYGYGIDFNGNGQAFITGSTSSSDLPVLNDMFGYSGDTDAFITGIDTNNIGTSSLIYSTYLGGSNSDSGLAIVVDNQGDLYVTGETLSSDFPVTNHLYGMNQPAYDAFITRIDTGLNYPTFSVYLGGDSDDHGYAIDVTDNRYIYVTGETYSTDFPLRNPYQADMYGNDAFITKIDSWQNNNSFILFSTYLGGDYVDSGQSVKADGEGHIFIAGYTGSTDFPAKDEYQDYQGSLGNYDGFVTCFDVDEEGKSNYIWSTFLGGAENDYIRCLAIDLDGFLYVTGESRSSDFPLLNEFQGSKNGGTDLFISKLAFGYNVNATVSGGNGSVIPATQNAISGRTVSIEIFPSEGFMIDTISDNGYSVVPQNPYHIYNIQDNHDVIVEFKELVYKVTAEVAGGNGTVSPNVQWVKPGENASITITPFTGFRIASIIDNGITMGISNPYIITSVYSNHEVKVKCIPDSYPPELILYGIRKTDSSWTITKEYAELTISIIEHPVKPIDIAFYFLLKEIDGRWDLAETFHSAGNHKYFDRDIPNGTPVRYKLGAYVLDGSRVSESEILEL